MLVILGKSFAEKLTVLGHLVTEKGIELCNNKNRAILNARKPENKQQFQSDLNGLKRQMVHSKIVNSITR